MPNLRSAVLIAMKLNSCVILFPPMVSPWIERNFKKICSGKPQVLSATSNVSLDLASSIANSYRITHRSCRPSLNSPRRMKHLFGVWKQTKPSHISRRHSHLLLSCLILIQKSLLPLRQMHPTLHWHPLSARRR